jgi:hypothetical protein
MLGNASFSIFSACCRGLSGLGGLGGGVGPSSLFPNCGEGLEMGVPAEITPDSWGSSSKSRGRAVVGDSGLVEAAEVLIVSYPLPCIQVSTRKRLERSVGAYNLLFTSHE